jgi:DNA-binding transcriptional LysR family regulator
MLNETDLSRIDLNLLVVFEAVLAERHVRRAAARLNLSPSAVSHGLGRLRRLLNDPVFLKTPKGVVPTERALALADPIADILARTRHVLASAAPFDAARSRRRFTLAAPDAVAAAILPPLLVRLEEDAPGVDLVVRGALLERAFADLDERRADIAIQPLQEAPARFVCEPLYREHFAIAVRQGHPLAKAFTLKRYCSYRHVLVSSTGEADGFVDRALEKQGLSRRVALIAPNFMLALAIVAETDHVSAFPSNLLAAHAARFGLHIIQPPEPWGEGELRAIMPKAALADAGSNWLFQLLLAVARPPASKQRRRRLEPVTAE